MLKTGNEVNVENERKWTAEAGRMEYRALFKWLLVVNVSLLFVVGLTALGVFVSLKLAAPFWAVRLFGALIFGLGGYFSMAYLRKAFELTRGDLLVEIFGDEIRLTQKEKIQTTLTFSELVVLESDSGEMGIGFLASGMEMVEVGCLHPTLCWKNPKRGRIAFELGPSDFLRLVGELGLEDEVKTRT